MPDLTDFLLARIAEDEQAAQHADGIRWRYQLWNGEDRLVDGDGEVVALFPDLDMYAMHAARWDPARVLAECEAKRRIVEHHQHWQQTLHRTPEGWTEDTATAYRMATEYAVQLLASVYADRSDFDPSWRVG